MLIFFHTRLWRELHGNKKRRKFQIKMEKVPDKNGEVFWIS
jgi:hypothetical protein